MSDSIKELCKEYEENVEVSRSRSVGLFTIPEYPEYEVRRGMWSYALDAILTTLRYLAPATLLTLLWGQQSFIFKLLKYIDSAFRSLLFTNDEQKQAVLQWLSEYGPVRVDDLGTVWRHGWIVCGVLDAILPGACAGHPPTSLSLEHAQAIADNYLGVKPVFNRQELELNETLSKYQEWRLTSYLEHLRQAVSKVTLPVTKLNPQKSTMETPQLIFDYIARGSGLTAAQINKTTYFKIYPTSQQSLDPQEITIVIKGPNNLYGMRVVPPVLGKAQLIRQQLLGVKFQSPFTENTLPLAHGTSYLRNFGKNDMSKTYYIPKKQYNIEIEVESTHDHAKIGYTVKSEGKYEIYITSKGQHIVGSPYTITASENIIDYLEKDNFCLEDGEEIDIVDIKSDRKVLVRIVDFVTEKMILKENGELEKITEDEAKYLMENDLKTKESFNVKNPISYNITSLKTDRNKKCKKFNKVANKVIKMNKVCKLLQNITNEKIKIHGENNELQLINQQDIPDVVNSTLIETCTNPFMLSNNRDKFIVPENISVSILTEKMDINECNDSTEDINDVTDGEDNITLSDLKILRDLSFDDENIIKPESNIFLNESNIQDNKIEKILGTFVTSEYESNKLENEETQNTVTKIIVDRSSESPSLERKNPFLILDILKADRPKSPIFKILPGDNKSDELICFDESSKITNNTMGKEYNNPFLSQHQSNNDQQNFPMTDFIIGAPVSLPPDVSGDLNKSLSHDPNTESMDSSTEKNVEQCLEFVENPTEKQLNLSTIKTENNTYSDIYSNLNENINECKKDLWDSAYVSIDENNILLDNNNNDSNIFKEVENNQNKDYLSNMGPAEREIWENCDELKGDILNKINDEFILINKKDLKKTNFTPIMEENDANILLGMKVHTKSEKNTETDPVTLALAEINDLCNDYYSSSENNFTDNDNIENHDKEIEQLSDYEYVKSASENKTDVMRHKEQPEGMISEVQTQVTESVSVSQILHIHDTNEIELNNTDVIKFGDYKQTNIVLEKKKYWDEKIRQIEANAEELRAQQRKRRLSAKQLRHNDSLSKRKGKQIVKKYLSTNEGNKKQIHTTENQQEDATNYNDPSTQTVYKDDTFDIKRVKNWKAFWDNKLETENIEVKNSTPKTNCFKTQSYSNLLIDGNNELKIETRTQSDNSTKLSLPVKQEIPEEVFKAFETSPKRFFGTSRKQILYKIDTSLGKPNTIDEPLTNSNETTCESGLVSSRISLFHNMSQSKVSSWSQRKTQSMHNIYHHKDNSNETMSTPDVDILAHESAIDDKLNSSQINQDDYLKQQSSTIKNITLKEKRARMTDTFYTKSVDETSYHRSEDDLSDVESSYVKKTVNHINKPLMYRVSNNCDNVQIMSSSKSEMDIFNKFSNKSPDEDFHKYKSCEELPKVNVKNFISLYECVSKSSETDTTKKNFTRNPESSKKQLKPACSISGTAADMISSENDDCNKKVSSNKENSQQSSTEYEKKVDILFNKSSKKSKETRTRDLDKQSTYLSLSDIDLEIVDKSSDKSNETSPEREIDYSPDYKSRFKLAKQYFQSLEELREVKKPKKLNECELLLYNKSKESPLETSQSKREKKKIKSHTMPSSEISQFWNTMQEQENNTKEGKLIKISEKFHVEDLFSDVMEGRLSRQGSMRGIPHKKAVLEAFRSMENISNNNLSPYELAVSQLSDFGDGNRVKNAQTYLNEYPYLPTTDPSKFQSRLDVNASGLISFKELINKRVRRNSVPDLRLNPSFTVNL